MHFSRQWSALALAASLLVPVSHAIAAPPGGSAPFDPEINYLCAAVIMENGVELVYQSSLVSRNNALVGNETLEIDFLEGGRIAARAYVKGVGEGLYKGKTGTNTPITVQIDTHDKKAIFKHAGRTAVGNCE